MIEIIIVISILVVLGSFILMASQSIYRSAKVRATQALLQRLKLAIDQYYSLKGYYPPDGIDSTVRNEEGVELRGSAALYQALSRPGEYIEMAGGIPQLRRHDALMDFKSADLSDEHPDYPGVREIVDAFPTPIHYDNTEDGRFQPQGGEVHYPPVEVHPEDPRTLPVSEGGVVLVGKPQSAGYDLWSHGAREHSTAASVSKELPIATWNLSGQ
ncbi:MAG: hypothetical protein JXA90_00575 [Planctomycetes bacterium]|nr:hypothetical protein [Planctomycetota bacterium]